MVMVAEQTVRKNVRLLVKSVRNARKEIISRLFASLPQLQQMQLLKKIMSPQLQIILLDFLHFKKI